MQTVQLDSEDYLEEPVPLDQLVVMDVQEKEDLLENQEGLDQWDQGDNLDLQVPLGPLDQPAHLVLGVTVVMQESKAQLAPLDHLVVTADLVLRVREERLADKEKSGDLEYKVQLGRLVHLVHQDLQD